MRFGLGVLRLSPAAFWSMTPRELKAAYDGIFPASAALPRSALAQLMQTFPDERP
ncbi:MAG: phage tail assembly chaperone [Hyphomicrobiales bacterium]|nr:phage tail assembly chaperone [Hyphomicrobiales bacterium]